MTEIETRDYHRNDRRAVDRFGGGGNDKRRQERPGIVEQWILRPLMQVAKHNRTGGADRYPTDDRGEHLDRDVERSNHGTNGRCGGDPEQHQRGCVVEQGSRPREW